MESEKRQDQRLLPAHPVCSLFERKAIILSIKQSSRLKTDQNFKYCWQIMKRIPRYIKIFVNKDSFNFLDTVKLRIEKDADI